MKINSWYTSKSVYEFNSMKTILLRHIQVYFWHISSVGSSIKIKEKKNKQRTARKNGKWQIETDEDEAWKQKYKWKS